MPKDESLHKRAFDVFKKACDLPQGERTDFVNVTCAGDGDLRAEVLSLLKYDDDPVDLNAALIDPARDVLSSTTHLTKIGHGVDEQVPERIGAYRIIRRIGEGGMGEVFEAEQDSPKRRVALKVIRAGQLSHKLVRRFENEAFVLGQLQHSGIAHIYESGIVKIDNREQPFFAMELVRGDRITTHADNQGFSIRQRLELMARVCDAVQHAHQRGVIHRDLKPANILVVEQGTDIGTRTANTSSTIDAIGQPKILDFGIARVTEGDMPSATMQTEVGQLVGTLAYMSPEQVVGDSSKLDTRCDVYALGVVSYQLLTKQMPLDITGQSLANAARIIQELDPVAAGTIVSSLRGDVETIIAKALEKNPDQRYESAAQLGADIRRYLGDEPIIARPASAMYNFRKFARRNKGLVSGLAATLVVLILGATGTAIGLVSALRANTELEQTNETLANTNRQLEQSNANLQNVSEFQSAQITSIDVPLMGQRFRADLFDSVADDRKSVLAIDLAEVNFVDIARRSLEQNYFQRAIDMVDRQFADQPLLRASMLQDLAKTMRGLGIIDLGVDAQERALEIRRQELGDKHDDTVASIGQSAILANERGEYSAADQFLRELVDTSKQLYGENDRRTLSAIGRLGDNLRLQSQLDDAEACARKAMDGIIEIAGPDDPQSAEAMSITSAVLMAKGEYEEAEQLEREALSQRRRTLGDEHHDTMGSMVNLCIVLEARGKYEESEELSQDAYKARERVLGSDHPDTLTSMNAVAAGLVRQGNYKNAEALFRKALAKRRALLGDNHPDTIVSMEHLASVLANQANYEESETLFREGLKRRKMVFGDDHRATLLAMGNLGYALNLQGKTEEAEPYYRDVLTGLRMMYGDDHPHTLTAVGNLASLLSGLGRESEAEPLYHESLEGRRRTLGDDHPSTLNAIYNMGDMFLRNGKLSNAELFCLQALEGYRRVGGDDNIGTLFSLTLVGRLRLKQDKPADAQVYFEEAVERRRRINGDDHPETANAIEGLAESLEAQDLRQDAESWRRILRDATAEAQPAAKKSSHGNSE